MGIENLNPKEFQAIKNLEQILGTEIPRLEYPIRSEKDLGFNTFGVYCEDGVVKEISLRRETHDYNSTTSSNNSLNNSSGKNSERSSGWVIHIEEQQSSFPEPLFELEHIRLLDFSHHKISRIPQEFSRFKNLRFLRLSSNKIESLPEFIDELVSLEELYLDKNLLQSVPESFRYLRFLRVLDFSETNVVGIPVEICYLKNLTKFCLGKAVNLNEIQLNELRKELEPKSTANVFISYDIGQKYIDLRQLAEYLEKVPKIEHVFFCEKDLIGNIDEFMLENIPKCQIFIFIATLESLQSPDCRKEIELALSNNLKIFPIKTSELTWNDITLSTISREYGIEYVEDVSVLFDNLNSVISNYSNKISLVSAEQRQIKLMKLEFIEDFKRLISGMEFQRMLEKNLSSIWSGYRERGGLHSQLFYLLKEYRDNKYAKFQSNLWKYTKNTFYHFKIQIPRFRKSLSDFKSFSVNIPNLQFELNETNFFVEDKYKTRVLIDLETGMKVFYNIIEEMVLSIFNIYFSERGEVSESGEMSERSEVIKDFPEYDGHDIEKLTYASVEILFTPLMELLQTMQKKINRPDFIIISILKPTLKLISQTKDNMLLKLQRSGFDFNENILDRVLNEFVDKKYLEKSIENGIEKYRWKADFDQKYIKDPRFTNKIHHLLNVIADNWQILIDIRAISVDLTNSEAPEVLTELLKSSTKQTYKNALKTIESIRKFYENY